MLHPLYSVIIVSTLLGQNPTPQPAPAIDTSCAEVAAALQAVVRNDVRLRDWPQLARYREQNRTLARPAASESRVVFMGDSITDAWQQPRWSEVWFPDAFAGTMAQLLCALEDGTEPEISGRDNLDTIALCEAVLQSGQEHRVCRIKEFLK